MFIVDLAADFRKGSDGSRERVRPRDWKQLRSSAPAVRSAEKKILNEWVAGLLKLIRRSVKIDPPFVQVGDSVGHIKRAFHVVGDNHARHSKALL